MTIIAGAVGALRAVRCTYTVISHSDLRTVKNISDNNSRENQNTHFMSMDFLSENEAVYVIKWKNVAEQDRSQMAI
jgi:hypothetical protein